MSGALLSRNRAAIVALLALFLALQPWISTSALAQQRGGDCSNDSLGLTPLIDMGDTTYMGFEGGLYPGATNTIPAEHLALGMSLLNYVGPLDADGQPSEGGSIGFMGVGVSTTGLDWDAFASLVAGESGINPQVVLVNGGVSGNPISQWIEPTDFPWGFMADQVTATGLTAAQIQVAWVMMPDRPQTPTFPGSAGALSRTATGGPTDPQDELSQPASGIHFEPPVRRLRHRKYHRARQRLRARLWSEVDHREPDFRVMATSMPIPPSDRSWRPGSPGGHTPGPMA